MPWKETTPVDQRLRFIAALSSCRWTMAELCRAPRFLQPVGRHSRVSHSSHRPPISPV